MQSVFLTARLCRMWSSELGHTKGHVKISCRTSRGFPVRVLSRGAFKEAMRAAPSRAFVRGLPPGASSPRDVPVRSVRALAHPRAASVDDASTSSDVARSRRGDSPSTTGRKGSFTPARGSASGRRPGSSAQTSSRALETASTAASTSAPSWKDEPAIGPLGIERAHLPRHVAVIMDGNARWASERGVAVATGHEAGVDTLRTIVRCCGAWDVAALTVYAFSHENWRRSRSEVEHLMSLLERTLVAELPSLLEEGVRVTVMGDMGMIDDNLRAAIADAVDATRRNTKLRLNVALSYGARQDIVNACRLLATQAAAGLIDPEDITEDVLGEHLASRTLPAALREPDLLIRPGGERRVSNFLLWELAYTELYFADRMWPDFGEGDFREALAWYAGRQRRFGSRG